MNRGAGELSLRELLYIEVTVKFQTDRVAVLMRINQDAFDGSAIVPILLVPNAKESLPIESEQKTLLRVRDEGDWDYCGPVKSVLIYPHDDCDPVRFEF